MTDPSPTDRMTVPEPTSAVAPTPGASPPSDASTPPPAAPPPSWSAPRSDGGRSGAVVFGLLLVLVGLWFFAERTLGLTMPDIEWGQLWPLLLIVLGGWLVIGSMRRR